MLVLVCLCASLIAVFISKLFKLPLEKEGQVGGPILAQEEMKTIFGSIPDIYEVHTRIKVVCPHQNPVRPTLLWWCHFRRGVCWPVTCVCVCASSEWPWGAPDRLVGGQECRRHHSQICEYKQISARFQMLNLFLYFFHIYTRKYKLVLPLLFLFHTLAAWLK